MLLQTSYGIIPLQKKDDRWIVLLIQHVGGHWAFPKGHPEENETPQQTAERELAEETGLSIVRFMPVPSMKEHYQFLHENSLVDKTVVYFLAEVAGKVVLQEREIAQCKWVPVEKASQYVTFEQVKKLCSNLETMLSQ